MASSVNSLLGASTPATGSTSSDSSASSAASLDTPSEGVFLQLLVSQLQNQDPLNPTDSTTFVTQLAQFSELEQVIGIRSDIESFMSTSSTSGSSSTGTPTTDSGAAANTPTANTQTTSTQNTN